MEVSLRECFIAFCSKGLPLDSVNFEVLKFKVKPSCYFLFYSEELNGFALRQAIQNGEPLKCELERKAKVKYPFVVKSANITAKFEKEEDYFCMTVFDYCDNKKHVSLIRKVGCVISPRKLPDLKLKLDLSKCTINKSSRSLTWYSIEARTMRITDNKVSFDEFEINQI